MAAALRRAGAEHVVAVDRGRLGARAGPEADVSFASPGLPGDARAGPAGAGRLRADAAGGRAATRSASPASRRWRRCCRACPTWRRRLPLALFLAALAVLSLALARPHATVAVPQEQASIVLVTDVSRSMLADDVEPSRLEAARAAAKRFLDQVPDAARVGIVAFSTEPHTVEPPTDDRGEVGDVLDGLNADGGTGHRRRAPGGARRWSTKGPRAKRPPAAILLLSDGETTIGRDPTEVARTAQAQGHPDLHGRARHARRDDQDADRRPRSRCRPTRPRCAGSPSVSGGRAFQAEDATDLSRIYESLGSRVASKKEKREITAAFAAGGAILLAAAAALGLRPRLGCPSANRRCRGGDVAGQACENRIRADSPDHHHRSDPRAGLGVHRRRSKRPTLVPEGRARSSSWRATDQAPAPSTW